MANIINLIQQGKDVIIILIITINRILIVEHVIYFVLNNIYCSFLVFNLKIL